MLYLVHGIDVDRFKQALSGATQGGRGLAPGTRIDFRYERDDELRRRIETATEEWRTVLANRYLVARDPFAKKLTEFDKARASAAVYSNQNDAARYIQAVDTNMAAALEHLKLAAGIENARMNLILERSFRTGLTWFGERHRARAAYEDAVTKYNDAMPTDDARLK
jgi:hypothetical protein